MYSFKCAGTIEVRNGVRIKIKGDICEYYRTLYTYYTYNTEKSQLPAHGAHVSVVLPKIHGVTNYRKVQEFHGQETYIWYDPEDVFISPRNVWLKVHCPIGGIIKERLGIIDKESFLGYHLVTCNFKY